MSELRRALRKYPQRTGALRVKVKRPMAELTGLNAEISALERELGARGRVLVRYSGTESKLRLLIEGPTDATVPLRRRMVQIVAENLVTNAIRHAGPGSTLTLTVGPGLLEAADDGRGVEQEELPRLFERFFRSDRARASRGTGLGLAIVKHVVTAAGGEVEATGGPGHGLTIRCLFSTSAPGRAS